MEKHKHKKNEGQSETFERRLKLSNTAMAIAILSNAANTRDKQNSQEQTGSSNERSPRRR